MPWTRPSSSFPTPLAARPFELLAFRESPLAPELQDRIHRLAAGRVPGAEVLGELARLDVELGERFAEAALEPDRRRRDSPRTKWI